jgi:voltage-gated potassium channel
MFLLISIYSVLFHVIMEYEGQHHSWLTGFYWALTVMSTLGFGDITFHSDLGRVFSIVVLLSGILLLLVLLPFTFIQFFYSPWIEAQNKSRAPRSLPKGTKNHIIFTSYDDITIALLEKFSRYGYDYIIVLDDLKKAMEIYDLGYNVGYGLLDDPETYKKMRADEAALIFASNTDEINTNIAFTIRELTQTTRIVTTADSHDSIDILELAGSDLVLEPRKMIGEAFARRTSSFNASATNIGQFENLIIAEAPAMGTPLVGKTLPELHLRENIGINVIGFWEHGDFIDANPEYVIQNSTVLVIVGEKKNIDFYNETLVIFTKQKHHVVIIGSGRVGKFVANGLTRRKIDYILIEKELKNVTIPEKTIVGNAADFNILEEAGIREAPTVIISTSDDDMNIYLTLYCRRLRPDIQIISRANTDKNVSTLRRAGADLVMSYTSLTANAVFNFHKEHQIIMLSEGIDIFTSKVPERLIGKNLITSDIRRNTDCNVIAIKQGDKTTFNPDPNQDFTEDCILVLIGKKESEDLFLTKYFS